MMNIKPQMSARITTSFRMVNAELGTAMLYFLRFFLPCRTRKTAATQAMPQRIQPKTAGI